jgi:hypothetical protein
MSGLGWAFIGVVTAHSVLCVAAYYVALRARIYTQRQLLAQSAIALLLPLVGPLMVVFMARDRALQAPRFDASRFDRDELPPHG